MFVPRWLVPYLIVFLLGVAALMRFTELSENMAYAIGGYALLLIGGPIEFLRRLRKLRDKERRR